MNAHSLQTGQMHRGGIAMSSQPNANFWQTKESPIHDGQRFSNQQGGYNQQSQLQQRKGSHLQILQQQQQQQHDEQQDSQQRQQLQHARKQQLQLQLQEQLHLQRQRQQHQQHQQQQSVAVSPSQENSQNGPSPGFDIQRVLHLYMHDYCLKQNYIKAANAIAADTGIRTDEGVPFGGDSPNGLLTQWFTTFWDNYTSSHKLPSLVNVTPIQPLPSPSSAGMRRNETEPTKRLQFTSDFGGRSLNEIMHLNQGGSSTPGSYSNEAKKAAKMWGDAKENVRPLESINVATLLGPEAADAMQKMGWGDRNIDHLNGEEKSRLSNVIKRSQLVQQHALQRIAQAHQNTSLDQSANRGSNGMAFQQAPLSLSQQQTQVSTDKPSPQQQTLGMSKKSPGVASNQRKKRRSSINVQALSQLQQQQQQSPSGSLNNIASRNGSGSNALGLGLAPSPNISASSPMSPAEAARNFEEHQMLARQLQVQTKGIIGQQQQQQQQLQHQQQSQASPMPCRNSDNSPLRSNHNAQNAQSEAQSQATSQLSAQIAQMKSQLSRQNGPKSGNKLNSNQISQLKALQGKLNYNVKGVENESMNQQGSQQNRQQHQPNRLHLQQQQQSRQLGNVGEMGPPPSPSSSTFFVQPPTDSNVVVMSNHQANSAPSTPALTVSNSNQSFQSTSDWTNSGSKSMYEPNGIYPCSDQNGNIQQNPASSFEQYSMLNQSTESKMLQQQKYHHHPQLAGPLQSNADQFQPLFSSASQSIDSGGTFDNIDFSNFDWSNLSAPLPPSASQH